MMESARMVTLPNRANDALKALLALHERKLHLIYWRYVLAATLVLSRE